VSFTSVWGGSSRIREQIGFHSCELKRKLGLKKLFFVPEMNGRPKGGSPGGSEHHKRECGGRITGGREGIWVKSVFLKVWGGWRGQPTKVKRAEVQGTRFTTSTGKLRTPVCQGGCLERDHKNAS